jgi:tetratricopeptide (TPR) repeat protein
MARANAHLRELTSDAWRACERLVQSFEGARHKGLAPDIADYLPPAGLVRQAALIELAHTDLELRLEAGEDVRVETYFARFPELAADAEAALGLVVAEFTLRRRREAELGLEEYRQRFPRLGEQVAARLAQQDEPPTMPADPASRIPWPSIPGYEALEELGRGGMGVVYKARQTDLDRLVALKLVLSGQYASPQERERFRAEALAAARLGHPGVVQVFEVGEHDRRPFLTLEYVEGGSLADLLRGGLLPAREAAELVERLARAVQAAHEKAVIHRDLKPANVLLSPAASGVADGTKPRAAMVPKITDFGLAKRLDAQAATTQSGAIVGTPSYMAPEQAGGKSKDVGPGVDLWALGVILYECLTGRTPFQGPTTTDIILRVLSDEPPPPRRLNPSVPRDLETITLKCLRKEPQNRYATAAELADDLGRFLRGEPIRARRLSLGERLWRRRRLLLAAGLALLVVALLGVGANALVGWRRERRDRAFEEAFARGDRLLAYGKKNAKEAIASFDEALRLRPDSSGALTSRGTAYATLGDNDRALADYDEALRFDPDNALAYRRRGWVYFTLGRYEDAVADHTVSIRLDPEQPIAWQGRAAANLNFRRWDDAANDLHAVLRLAPDEVESYHGLSMIRAAQGRWAEAARDFARTRPSLANALFTQASAALAGGEEARYRGARDRLLTLAEATGSPSDTAQAARAHALAEKTEIDLSRLRRMAEAGLKGQRDDSFFLRIRALVWLRADRVEDAVRQCEAMLKAKPDYNPGINYLLLSIAHGKLGHTKEASDAFERAVKAGPPVSHVHDTLEYQVLLREASKDRK